MCTVQTGPVIHSIKVIFLKLGPQIKEKYCAFRSLASEVGITRRVVDTLAP